MFSGMNEDIYICQSCFLTHEMTASEWQSLKFQVAFCWFCGRYPWDCWDVVLDSACAGEADSCCLQEYYLRLPWSWEIIEWELSKERVIVS